MLTFDTFKLVNRSRSNRWHKGGLEEWSVTDLSNALAGEVGEACNAVKKLRRVEDALPNLNEDESRQLDTRAKAVAAIGEELADTFCYLDLLAQRLGIDLEAAIISKFNIVSERYGFPERL